MSKQSKSARSEWESKIYPLELLAHVSMCGSDNGRIIIIQAACGFDCIFTGCLGCHTYAEEDI